VHAWDVEVALSADATIPAPEVAILRLVYGRNRPERDGVTATGSVTLEDLRALFPGY
jgi:hypothetical protein